MSRWPSILLLALLTAQAVGAQEYGVRLGTVKRGGKVSFEPTGPGVLFDALDPALRKWYVPQELYSEYRWQQAQYTNYAREAYQRYVSTSLEGRYYYDEYGNLLTRGWLIYDWREQSPQPFGSSLSTSGYYGGWFSRLLVSADHKGQYHYAITVGSEIRTTLTPMTFSKPRFNGLQWDLASDKYQGTLLLSRISAPNPENTTLERPYDQRTDATNLLGGRLVAQVGDFVKVGGTFVNAYQVNTQVGTFGGDMFRGQLSGPQNFNNVTAIEVRLSDDSPEDGEAGAALFASDLLIEDLQGQQVRGSEIGFRAQVEGGFQQQGFLSADGTEKIRLRFDFSDRSYSGPDPGEIRRVTVELVVANDYYVEVTSDRQLGSTGMVFLPVTRAPGNVKDSSNQRVITFDYGLPTANQIAGFTLEATDLAGFDAYAEVNVNRQYRQYPNLSQTSHHAASTRADVWLVNLSHTRYPWFAFGEAFSVGTGYSTGLSLLDKDGNANYANAFYRYEFVEDNDDQDRYPDWFRKGSGDPDREVFPGWDENNDFVSDFNQNDNEDSPNLIPDYQEPFLRFYTDSPEYLYGVDMNHNQWVDRFENDEEPDYPYRRDQQGYNLYGGAFIVPQVRLTLGRQQVRRLSQDQRSHDSYALFTLDQDRLAFGRVRAFLNLQRVKDDIADDLYQWVQLPDTRGGQRYVRDILPAENTWVYTTWLGLEHEQAQGLYLAHKNKWQLYRQVGSRDEIEVRGVRRQGYFLGVVDKAEYQVHLGSLTLVPRWKSELRREAPVAREESRRSEVSQLLSLLGRWPFLGSSVVETGLEYQRFWQLRRPTPQGAEDSFRELVIAAQLSNRSDYQGYKLVTILGFEVTRRQVEDQKSRSRVRGFVSVYAGLER
ncbi:MAG: hypothetical protein WDA75_14040 [Candidatus Latescibacterota bacterium]|jgi:hypothetical protein